MEVGHKNNMEALRLLFADEPDGKVTKAEPVAKWKELGPLDVDEILSGQEKPDFTHHECEYGVKTTIGYVMGRPGTYWGLMK